MLNPPNLANVRHAILGADAKQLWDKMDALLAAEWAHLGNVDKQKASLAKVQSMLIAQSDSKYLGVGTAWLDNDGIQMSTTHAIMNKAGGCRDGAFVILIPAFEQLMHAITGGRANSKKYECPRVAMIAKIKGKPYPADASDRDRIVKAFSEFPSSAASFDTSSISSLHYMHLRLQIQKYVSLLDPGRNDSDPHGLGKAYSTYHVDSWNYEPMCWMAISVDESLLGALLNAKPSETSFAFGRLATSDIVLPALPQCPAAPEPELSFDPSHMFRSRVGVLGASGSGKSNLIKNLLLALKGPKSPWWGKPELATESTVGLLLLDPQGEYAEANRQGMALADLINADSSIDPKAHVYSFHSSSASHDSSRRVLKINFFLEPSKAIDLAKTLPGGESNYLRSAFSAHIPQPLGLLRKFVASRFPLSSHEGNLALAAFDAWVNPGSGLIHVGERSSFFKDSSPALFKAITDQWATALKPAQANLQYYAREVLDWMLDHARLAHPDHQLPALAAQERATFAQEWQLIAIWWLTLSAAGFEPEGDLAMARAWIHFFAAIGHPLFSLPGRQALPTPTPPPISSPVCMWSKAPAGFAHSFSNHLKAMADAFEANAAANGGKMAGAIKALSQIGIASPTPDMKAWALFLLPNDSRAGPAYISSLRIFHSTGFVDAESQLVDFVIAGNTCVVNLADAGTGFPMELKRQFAERICEKLFQKLQAKFAHRPNQDAEPDFNVILAIEEAQELLSARDEDKDSIFKKIALQGRKLGLGVLFATQSPSNIDQNLYKECNMIFCMNLKSVKEIGYLKDQQIDFHSVQEKLAAWQKPGLGHWWRSDALILPFMASEFPAKSVYNPPPPKDSLPAASPNQADSAKTSVSAPTSTRTASDPALSGSAPSA